MNDHSIDGLMAAIEGDTECSIRMTLVAPTVESFIEAHKAATRHLGVVTREGEGASTYTAVWTGDGAQVTLSIELDKIMQTVVTPTAADVITKLKEK